MRSARPHLWFGQQLALGPSDPKAKLFHTFDVLAAWVAQPGCCGCVFISAALQLNDPAHPAFSAAAAEKASMRMRLEELARAACLREPRALARELSLLVDGASQELSRLRSAAGSELAQPMTLATASAT